MAQTLRQLAASMAVCLCAEQLAEGEIALSAPQCPFFVVHTEYGFSLLNEQEYLGVYEGDRVRGSLHSAGEHPIQVVGEMTVAATVESWGNDSRQAAWIFHRRCKTRPIVNHDQD
jgi:hypothetical protein